MKNDETGMCARTVALFYLQLASCEYNNLVRAIPILAFFVLNIEVASFAQVPLLRGTVINESRACYEPKPLVLQFLGQVSPRVQLDVGESQEVSLPRGVFTVAVYDQGGNLWETPLVLIDDENFILRFGCPAIKHGKRDEPKIVKGKIRFANTTADCGDEKTVIFVLDGVPYATVQAGSVIEALAPLDVSKLEVVSVPEGKRLLVMAVQGLKEGDTLYYGCTDPTVKDAKGVMVVFENNTHRCEVPRHLTLWVDFRPKLGLKPGERKALYVEKGQHDFRVTEGLGGAQVLKGIRNVVTPLKVHFGCQNQGENLR